MPAIAGSILDTTKKALGIEADYDAFDIDILMHINTVFSTLNQLGVGPDDGYMIEDSSALWSSYLSNNKLLNLVKTYMYLQVRMYFDPPATSFDLTAKKEQIQELTWRITVMTEPPVPEPVVEEETYEDLIWTVG